MNLAIKMFLAEYDSCPFRNEYEKINWACKEVGVSEFIAELRSLQQEPPELKLLKWLANSEYSECPDGSFYANYLPHAYTPERVYQQYLNSTNS